MLDVLAGVCLDFFHATDFGDSEHSKEKEYEVYFLFVLSYSAVSIGTGATSYKRLVQVSPIFSAFIENFLELLRLYSYSVVPLAYCYNVYVAGCKSTVCKVNLRTRKTRTYLSLSSLQRKSV